MHIEGVKKGRNVAYVKRGWKKGMNEGRNAFF
jgi:hypothetical protein